MKKFLLHLFRSANSSAVFIRFVITMTVISIFGGYQLSKLISGMNNYSLQSTDQLLAIEENLDDVAISLGSQIQEWKDMLLRIDNETLYQDHRRAFLDSTIKVQAALLQAKTGMQNIGMKTDSIDQLRYEHKELVSSYLKAQSMLASRNIKSSQEVDRQIRGVDRNLQQHISLLKSDIEYQAIQNINRNMPALGKQYLLVGLLGTISLLVMSLLGFVFVTGFEGRKPGLAD